MSANCLRFIPRQTGAAIVCVEIYQLIGNGGMISEAARALLRCGGVHGNRRRSTEPGTIESFGDQILDAIDPAIDDDQSAHGEIIHSAIRCGPGLTCQRASRSG